MRERQFTDCVDIVGSSCKPFEGNRRYISTGAVATDHIDESDVEIVDHKSRPSRADLVVEPETLLFAKMQGTKKTLYVDKESAENIYSTGFFALKAKSGVISTRCLYHLLGSASFLTQKDKNCSGATQKAITNAGLKKIRVSIPDYQLQEAIADQLDKISSVIQMRRSELQKLDDLVKARFVEMFGNLETNEKCWIEKPLGELCEKVIRYPTFYGMDYLASGTRVIRIGNILEDGHMDIDNANYVFVYDNVNNDYPETVIELFDIVMAVRGDGSAAKRIGIIREKSLVGANISPNLIRIKAADSMMHPVYLFYYLTGEVGQKRLDAYVNKTAKKNIAAKDIVKVIVPTPPKDLQQDFADFVQQIDKSKFVESIYVLKLIKEAIAKEVSHDRIR